MSTIVSYHTVLFKHQANTMFYSKMFGRSAGAMEGRGIR